MLQPPQLEGVSVQYAAEILEIRRLLASAVVPVETSNALPVMAERLRVDGSFHRDLALHVWLWMSRKGAEMSPADMVAVLAIAAAGEHGAALAGEGDAHELLRFVLEVGRKADEVSPEIASGRPASARIERPLGAVPRVRGLAPVGAGAHRTRWMGAAVCLLALLLAGTWFALRRAPVGIQRVPDRVPEGNAVPVVASSPKQEAAGPIAAPVARLPIPEAHRAGPPAVPPKVGSAPAAQAATLLAAAPPPAVVPGRMSASTPTAGLVLPPMANVRVAEATPALPRASQAKGIVPVESLSRQLGARRLPAYASGPEFDAAWHPRLLRRSATPSGEQGQLFAELSPVDGPNIGGVASAALPAGVVRPAVLGMMAGNVLYSPAPAYPSAASAARVQGEVKVQAEVDRDGNVSYARVVSGPPLLRQAAIDAVQHWRYKPYLAGGKAIPMTSIAVLDFELP